jgi:hypothetical protein
MADHLHRSQPQARLVQLRHRPYPPRLLLPHVQGQPQHTLRHLARQGHSFRLRAPRQQIPQHAGLEERFQDAVCKPQRGWCEESAPDQWPLILSSAVLGEKGTDSRKENYQVLFISTDGSVLFYLFVFLKKLESSCERSCNRRDCISIWSSMVRDP